MRIPRIYIPDTLECERKIRLDKKAANHVTRVLRLKAGASIILFNGQGGEYEAVLDSTTPDNVCATITGYDERDIESNLELILAQGISRGERMDYTLQKSVELGVNQFIPLTTERCGVKLEGERLDKRHQHWQSVIASACEQCGRNRLPGLFQLTTLANWLSGLPVNENTSGDNKLKLVLNHRADQSLSTLSEPASSVLLLVGPEGGLSEVEIKAAQRAGFTPVRLGPRVLRTETAGVAALAAIQTLWGDLG